MREELVICALSALLWAGVSFAEEDTTVEVPPCSEVVVFEQVVREKGQLEVELKYALTEADYDVLRSAIFGQHSALRKFRTYYLDDAAFNLKESDVNLRVRVEGESTTLGLKLPAREIAKSIVKSKRRWEWESDLAFAHGAKLLMGQTKLVDLEHPIVDALKKRFTVEDLDTVTVLGYVETQERLEYLTSHGHKLELDKCSVHGEIIYELEVETDNPDLTHTMMLPLFETWNVNPTPNAKSKRARLVRGLPQQ